MSDAEQNKLTSDSGENPDAAAGNAVGDGDQAAPNVVTTKSNRGVLLTLVLALIAFLAGVAVFPLLQDNFSNRQPQGSSFDVAKLKSLERAMTGAASDLEVLRQQVNELQNRVKSEFKQGQQAATIAASGFIGKLEGLQQQVKLLANKLAAMPEKQIEDSVIPTLNKRIQQLENLVKETTENVAAANKSKSFQELSTAIDTLKQRVTKNVEFATNLVKSQTQKLDKALNENQELRLKITGLEKRIGIQSARQLQDALGLALSDLSRAIRNGGEATAVLNTIQRAAKPDEKLQLQISKLQDLLKTPVATLVKLQREFPDLVKLALTAERAAGDGIWSSAVRRLSGLVSLRRTGEVSGDTSEAILARAETRLNTGDLTGALKQLSALKGAAADALNKWRTEARRRLAAETAVARLRAVLIATMAAAK